MSFVSNLFGGGGSQPSVPASQTSVVREAPGIEERKIELMDIARQVAQKPVSIPSVQVAPLSALEQQGITAAGQTGIGAGTVGQGIQSVLGAPTAATTAQQLAGQYGAGAVGAAALGQQQAGQAGQLASLYGTRAVGAAGLGQQQAGQAGQLASLYGAGAMRTAAAGPNINQFLNPYQQYVIDEINRQSQMEQNRLAAQAVGSGAFGGGRQGIQAAEQERARLGQIGQLQAEGFQTALGAAQRQQQLATQTGLQAGQLGLGSGQLGLSGAQLGAQTGLRAGQLGLGAGQLGLSGAQLGAQTGLQAGQLGLGAGQLGLSGAQLGAQTGLRAGQLGLSGGQLAAQTGLAAGQQLGQLGLQQQQQAQADISQLMGAGGLQRQLAQQALEAQRATQLQQAYEPYQRVGFLSNVYAAGPKSQSQIEMATAPQAAPLAQSIGTGLGAFQAFSGMGA